MNMNENLYGIPIHWSWTTLGEISDVIGGGTPKTKEKNNFDGGQIPWITPADLSGYSEKYISHGQRNITEKGLVTSSARLFPEGTVLFTSRAPIGYVAIAKNPVCTNQGFKSFVLKSESILSDYVYWYLKGSKSLAESYASGTTFLELSGANAKRLPIPIAPLNEQKRIVAEIEKQFSRLDEAVENLKRVKANLKRYKAAILKAAVEGRFTDEWRKTHPDVEPADQLLDRILAKRRRKWEEAELAAMKAKGKNPKDDHWKKYKEPLNLNIGNLPPIPNGWLWVKLESVSEALGGYAFKSKKFSKAGHQIVKMANIKMNILDLAQHPSFINDIPDFLYEKYKLIDGDILITLTGTRKKRDYGYTVEIKNNQKSILLNQRIARLRPYIHGMSSYIAIAMQSENFRNRFFSHETGNVGQGNVGMAAVTKEAIALPPLEEQKAIIIELERCFSLADRIYSTVEQNLNRAGRLRQSILKKAFSGQLVPQTPNDEPGSELLGKIKNEKQRQAEKQVAEKKIKHKTLAVNQKTR